MVQNYNIILNSNNHAYKKYYQTYIKNKDNIDNIDPLTNHILGNTCKLSERNIKLYNSHPSSAEHIKIHKEYGELVHEDLIDKKDKNIINKENIFNTENTLNIEDTLVIPNEYNTFRDIHYYFTQFCYKIKDGIYELFHETVVKNNRNYTNCLRDLSEYLIPNSKNTKTFKKILEYMCDYNYRKLSINEYILEDENSNINSETKEDFNVVSHSHKEVQLANLFYTVENILSGTNTGDSERIINKLDDNIEEVNETFFTSTTTAAQEYYNNFTRSIAKKLDKMDIDINKFIQTVDSNINVWYSDVLDHYLVVFRGTKGKADIMVDAALLFNDTDNSSRLVGDYLVYTLLIQKYIKEKETKESIVTFAGHSLGGLIAKFVNRKIIENTRPYLVITYNYFALAKSKRKLHTNIENEFDIFSRFTEFASMRSYIKNKDYPNHIIIASSKKDIGASHKLDEVGRFLYKDTILSKDNTYTLNKDFINIQSINRNSLAAKKRRNSATKITTISRRYLARKYVDNRKTNMKNALLSEIRKTSGKKINNTMRKYLARKKLIELKNAEKSTIKKNILEKLNFEKAKAASEKIRANALQIDRNAERTKSNNLRRELNEIKDIARTYKTRRNAEKTKATSLQKDRNAEKTKANALRRELNVIINEVNDLTRTYKTRINVEKTKEKTKAKIKSNALQKERNAEKTRADALQKERNEEKTKATNLQKERNAERTKSTNLQKERNAEKTKATNLQKERNAERTKATNLQKERNAEKTKANTLQKKHTVAIGVAKIYKTRRNVLRGKHNAEKIKVTALQKERNAEKTRANTLQKERNAERTKVNTTKKHLLHAMGTIRDYRDDRITESARARSEKTRANVLQQKLNLTEYAIKSLRRTNRNITISPITVSPIVPLKTNAYTSTVAPSIEEQLTRRRRKKTKAAILKKTNENKRKKEESDRKQDEDTY